VRLGQLHRSLTFRLALLYLVLFTASVALLLGVAWVGGVARPLAAVERQAAAEGDAAAKTYRQGGLPALVAFLKAPAPPGSEPFRALLGPGRRALIGAAPTRVEPAGAVARIEFPDPDGSGPRDAVVSIRRLGPDLTVIVGHDVERLEERADLIEAALGWSAVIAPTLGLLVGLAMSLAVSRRIEAVTSTARAVMAGDLSRRVEVRGTGDDFDQLAETLNLMLARIDGLVQSVRSVSDHVAHELRTPLTRLRAELEILGREPSPARVERALEEAERLQSIFDALLRIARIEAGRHGAAQDALDPAALLSDAVDFYLPEAEAKGVSIEADLPAGLALRGDRDLLFQAVCNLLDNAVKHTPPGGRIRVEAREDAGRLHIAVADTGPGVAPEHRARVVERFYRAPGDEEKPGLGLGLPLVSAVAALHGGTLELQSAEPGLRAVLRLGRSKPRV